MAALASAVEMRDPCTAGHESRVAQFSDLLATALDCDGEETESIELTANIHDIDRIAIPAGILTRTGKISTAEIELLRAHDQIGSEMLE